MSDPTPMPEPTPPREPKPGNPSPNRDRRARRLAAER